MKNLQIGKQSNLILTCGEYTPSDEFKSLVEEFDGLYELKDQLITVNLDGSEFDISYDIELSGNVIVEKGDYFTPGSINVEVNEDISINSVTSEDGDITLTKDVVGNAKKIINKLI